MLPLYTALACNETGKPKGANLHIAVLGDSNTAIGGDNCDNKLGWTYWLAKEWQPASIRSFARSGATWTHTPQTRYNTEENIGIIGNDNVIYNQVCRLKEAVKRKETAVPQLILIAAGTNDVWFANKRPQVYAQTVEQVFAQQKQFITNKKANEITGMAEAIRYDCELLMEAFPQAQIVLLTPMQTIQAPIADIIHAGNVIESTANYLSIPVIRQDKGGSIYATREKQQSTMSSDGTHVNEKGAQHNGYWIAHQLLALLAFSIH